MVRTTRCNGKPRAQRIAPRSDAQPRKSMRRNVLDCNPDVFPKGKHTIFGRIKSGMNIIQRVGAVSTDNTDRPVNPVTVVRAYLTPE
jgi:hypothetical protein